MMTATFRQPLRLLAFLLLITAFAVAQAPPPDMDQWVTRAMKEFEVPGLAVGIVKDGKLVFAKGYGVRKLGEAAPVDENTTFGIASNTKAFTAASLAILVDEGKVSWDDPVIKHLPSFHLYDPYVSRELTIRDLLSHRSGLGLGAGDLMYWPDTDFTRAQVLAAARHIRPAASLRSKYAYNNLTFVVAGEIVPAVTGKPWDDFVRERIFTPLQMASTTITSSGFKNGANVAVPHSRGWRLQGELKPITWTRDEVWAAAAGIKSNVTDLSKWVLLQLNRGKLPNGQQLWQAKTAAEMWSPQTVIRISEPPAPLKATKPNFSAYGLGWSLRDYKGRKIVSHGGALTGMLSSVYMVPEENLGIIVLTNQEEGGAFSSIIYHILDHYFELQPTDWIAAYKAARKEQLSKSNAAEKELEQKRATDSRPSLPLDRYAGEYEDPWYGKAVLQAENGRLVLRMSRTPSMIADLQHWQHDTFRAVFRDPTIPDAFLTFALDPEGKIDQIKMVPVSDLADFSFDYQDLELKPVRKPNGKS